MKSIPVVIAAFGSLVWAGADLKNAVIVSPAGEAAPAKAAARMLMEEIEKCTGVGLRVASMWPSDGSPVLAVMTGARPAGLPATYTDRLISRPKGDEGFRLQVIDDDVIVAGNSPVGTLFGVGYLLRSLRMDRGVLELAGNLKGRHEPTSQGTGTPDRLPPEGKYLRRMDPGDLRAIRPGSGWCSARTRSN